MAEVFISFIHEEQELADAVQAFLWSQLKGVFPRAIEWPAVFLSSDHWQIDAGEQWLVRIKKELTSAKVVVALMSGESVKREWVNFEAGAAWAKDIVLIPTVYWGLRVGELPRPYNAIQAVDLEAPDGPEYLFRSIARRLNAPEVPEPFWDRIGPPEYQRLRAVLAQGPPANDPGRA